MKGLSTALGGKRLQGDAAINCVTALAVFTIMTKQIKTAQLLPITDNEINLKIASLLVEKPGRKRERGTDGVDSTLLLVVVLVVVLVAGLVVVLVVDPSYLLMAVLLLVAVLLDFGHDPQALVNKQY